MQFQVFDHLKDSSASKATKAFESGLTMLRQAHFEARRLIAGVRPPILDESGIVEAIAHLVHEQGQVKGPKIEFHSDVRFDRVPAILENAVYRIVQEGSPTPAGTARARRCGSASCSKKIACALEIRDWGTGFDATLARKNRFGLEGIRQRARMLGGKCRVRSGPGKGTRITVELPVVSTE